MMGQNDDDRSSPICCHPSRQNSELSEQNDGYLEPFVHQVGGHCSVLSLDERTVCKPYSLREHKFYEILPCEFKEFVPEFRGLIEVGLIEDNSGYLMLNADSSTIKSIKSQNAAGLRRKCESTNSLPTCKKRSLGRIRLKRSGSLEFANSKNCTTHDDEGPTAFTDDLNGSSSSYSQNPWALQCQTRQITKMQRTIGEKEKFLLLENLVSNFNLPCILDLKMGYRQYGDDATQAKRSSQALKCERSTSAALGIRMCGMQVYHADSGVFKCYNKYYGRTLSVDGFKQEIFRFWHNGIRFRSDLLPLCIEKLIALKQIVSQAAGYRFFSSSLLIIYEGDIYRATDQSTNVNVRSASETDHHPHIHSSGIDPSSDLVDVRMIDFEHTTCPEFFKDAVDPTISYAGCDKGYVEGVVNLIDILNELIEECNNNIDNKNKDIVVNANIDIVDDNKDIVGSTEDIVVDSSRVNVVKDPIINVVPSTTAASTVAKLKHAASSPPAIVWEKMDMTAAE